LPPYSKLFIANPDLPLRFAKNLPLNMPDQATFYGGDERGISIIQGMLDR
jgi:N-ethylmaleimide reductase